VGGEGVGSGDSERAAAGRVRQRRQVRDQHRLRGRHDDIGGGNPVDDAGRTLYVFMKDTDGKSACNGACANLWPPLTASGDTTGGTGVDAAKLSTMTRDDGSKQVTYGGKPLYRYSPDTAPGDAKGQGIGGVWFTVSPAGTPITSSAAAGGAATTTTAAVTPGY
jgi:predicted lipoprotein with Yx(FWY)xxD motif